MNDFIPEYPGDTPNRQWVRDKCRERGYPTDLVEVAKKMPQSYIDRLFWKAVNQGDFQ